MPRTTCDALYFSDIIHIYIWIQQAPLVNKFEVRLSGETSYAQERRINPMFFGVLPGMKVNPLL